MQSPWLDINATFSHLFPPIVPAGRYKYKYRGYTSKNETLFYFENQMDVIPTREYRAMGELEVFHRILFR